MADIRILLPYVRLHASGVPDIVALPHLRDAHMEFCRESEAFMGFMPVTADQFKYTIEITVPIGNEVNKVDSVLTAKEDAQGKRIPMVDGEDYWMIDATHIQFRKTLHPQAIQINFSMTPQYDSNVIDDRLGERWGEFIAMGAASRLLGMANEAWYNPQPVQYFRQEFTKAYRKAFREKKNNYRDNQNLTRRREFF